MQPYPLYTRGDQNSALFNSNFETTDVWEALIDYQHLEVFQATLKGGTRGGWADLTRWV
jgi:hypothetical protein